MRKLTAIAVLIMVVVAGAAFAGKTTMDPNAPGHVRPAEDTDKPDTRLAQKVTYKATRKTVSSILADLTKQTGVTLKAGINEHDWQVRDRKMNVFLKDTPLKDVIDSIGRVMKFQWATGGKGDARTYRLFMDRKTLLDAEAKRVREEQKRDKEMADKRVKALKDFMTTDQLSPEGLAKLKEERPFDYVLAKSGISSAMGAFFKEAPAALDALASGRKLALGGANLSPAARDGLLKTIGAMLNLGATLGQSDGKMPEGLAENIGRVTVQLNEHLEEAKSQPGSDFVLGEISVRWGDNNAELPFLDPDSKLAKILGKAVIKSQDEGRSMDDVMKEVEPELMQTLISEIKKTGGGEAPVEHPDDPALDEKIKMKPEGNRLAQMQQALQEASKLSVVSDSFGQGFVFIDKSSVQGEMQIRKLLERIADGSIYNWEKHGDVVEFRDKNWYKKRAVQIPEAWIEGWRNILRDTGTLDIGELAQIAALTPEQIDVNITADDDLSRSGVPWAVLRSRNPLKLWGSLSEAQRAAALSKSGLNLRGLAADQWSQIETLVNANDSALLENPEAKLTLTCVKSTEDKHLKYAFSVSASEGSQPAEWTLSTPEYKEPPKEPEKDAKDKTKETAPSK